MIINLVKVFVPLTAAFVFGILLTPALSHYLYSRKMWKKKAKTVAPDGRATPIFNKLHAEREVSVPKLGGTLIWVSTGVTVIGLWLLARVTGLPIFLRLDFLSRNQTWIPLVAMLLGALVGLVDDLMEIRGNGDHISGGLSLRKRLAVVSLIALLVSLWFYFKLGVETVGAPSWPIFLGPFFIPFFVLVVAAVYSGGIIDGVDGLAGGVFAAIFTAYASIAFFQNQINLAAFSASVAGATLAFLWFNIPPARFYMSETGSMALTVCLGVVAFMTDSLGGGRGVLVLPIIALPLVVTALSVIIQLLSKKFRNGKKVFLVAPLHHHFEALGWPPYKVTMRYWVFSVITAVLGVILAVLR